MHDGGHHYRDQKIALLADAPELMQELQVCWDHQTQNCGTCLKCLRTRIVIAALGIEGAPFAPASLHELIRGVRLDSPRACQLAIDMIHFLRRVGQPKYVPLLQRRVTVYRLMHEAKLLAKQHFDPRMLDGIRRFRGRAEDTKIARILDPVDVC